MKALPLITFVLAEEKGDMKMLPLMIAYYMLSAFYILYIYKIGFTSILKMTKVRKVTCLGSQS